MPTQTLPSNVDDPRFGEASLRPNTDWDGPEAVPQWVWDAIEGFLDALSQVVERVLHR